MDTAPVQVFIKNEAGQIWGPLALSTVELLFDSGIVAGKVMVSPDGEHYGLPGRFPEFRDAFPQEVWGVDVPAGAAPARVAPVEEIYIGADTPGPPAPHPAPGPGAAPKAGPGAVASASFTAGPGVAAAAQRAKDARTSGPKGPAGQSQGGSGPKPPPATTTAQGAPPSGSLREISAVKVYARIAALEQTAFVTFKLADREIQVHLRKGNPEFVASTHAEDEVGAFLVKVGLCKQEQVDQATAQKDRFGGELLSALFGLGVLNPGTAFAQLMERSKALLGRALLAAEGSFVVEHKELSSQKTMPLGHRWGVLAELVRRIPVDELRRRMHSLFGKAVMRSGGFVAAGDLRLTPQETRALSYIDGSRSLAQFQVEKGPEFETILRMVFFLGELDGVSFGDASSAARPAAAPPPSVPPAAAPKPPSIAPAQAPVAAAPKAAAPKPAAPPKAPVVVAAPIAAPPPTATPVPTETLEGLRAVRAKMKDQNHFEVLGLTEKSDAGQIKVAYLKAAKAYHPDTVPENSPPEWGQLKQDIFGRIGEAYRTLSDDKQRANYIDELKFGGGEKVDVAQILLGEELFQKGCILVKARKWADAVKMLDDAIQANAEEPEFLAWRGYAKYFATADKAAGKVEAMKDIGAALKRNDRIAAAHYFTGHLAKLTNDLRTAEQEFRRTVELNPTHIDAQRELRMLGKK